MPIPSDHSLGLMAHPLIDHLLIESLQGTVRSEAVPEDVPASESRPFRPSKGLNEVMFGTADSQRSWYGNSLSSPLNSRLKTESVLASGMVCEPFIENRFKPF